MLRDENRPEATAWRGALAGPAVAVLALVAALFATSDAGVSLRDPDGVASSRLLVAFALVAVLIALEAFLRAGRVEGTRRPPLRAVAAALRAAIA